MGGIQRAVTQVKWLDGWIRDAGNVTEKEKLVTFGSPNPNHDDVENHKQMTAIDEEEGDAEDEETLKLKE